MNRISAKTSIILAVAAFVLVPVWGKDYKFQIPRATTLHGVELEPGQYNLKLDENDTAALEKNGRVIVSSRVQVGELARKVYGVRLAFGKEGELAELTVKNKRVRFLGPEAVQAQLNR